MDVLTPRVLCVDDCALVLEGLETTLGWSYRVTTALGAEPGIAALRDAAARKDPFAVVISDMRMPGIDGAQFLAQVRREFPQTTRMLLTGYTDLDSAMKAVNQGALFRMLLKPCPAEELEDAVEQGVHQHRLLRAERELLDETLTGAIYALTDALALASPITFGHANPLRAYVRHMARRLGHPESWAFEVAAMCAPLGHLAVPDAVLHKYLLGQPLDDGEEAMLDDAQDVAYRLLSRIPRLESVALMVRFARRPERAVGMGEAVVTGAKILHVAKSVELLTSQGESLSVVLSKLQGTVDEALLELLHDFSTGSVGYEIVSLPLDRLIATMRFEADVMSEGGQLLVKKGQRITEMMIERLRNFDRSIGVAQPILVKRVVEAPPRR